MDSAACTQKRQSFRLVLTRVGRFEVHDAFNEHKPVDTVSELCRELKKERVLLVELCAVNGQLCSRYGHQKEDLHAVVDSHVASITVSGKYRAVERIS